MISVGIVNPITNATKRTSTQTSTAPKQICLLLLLYPRAGRWVSTSSSSSSPKGSLSSPSDCCSSPNTCIRGIPSSFTDIADDVSLFCERKRLDSKSVTTVVTQIKFIIQSRTRNSILRTLLYGRIQLSTSHH